MVPLDFSFPQHCVNLALKNYPFSKITRVNDATHRILKVKNDLGLFESLFPFVEDLSKIGTSESEALNLEASRESIFLAKNRRKILPLSKSE